MEPFLAALRGGNSGRPPVWLMRQAGRYLPEYRHLRGRYSFLEMCHQPQLAAEVTLLPLRRYPFDAAILFSDILVVAEALGVGLQFIEEKGPLIERPVRTAREIACLNWGGIEQKLAYVGEAIALLKKELSVPLIGFCGAPFTVASYLIEGKSDRDLPLTKQWMYADPQGLHQLLEQITEATIDYLNLQIKAGVDVLQVFDSWAGALSEHHFCAFSLKYLNRLVQGLKTDLPLILFCRGSSLFAKQLATLPVQGLSIDWHADLAHIRQILGPQIALQGNLDPDLLFAPLEVIRKETKVLLDKMRGDPRYIVNLGHGVKPGVKLEAVQTLVETVHAEG